MNALMFMFYQSGRGIPNSWILLDSQSTVDIFCNLDLLKNICWVSKSMQIRCKVTNLVSDLPGYRLVCFDPLQMFLSLKIVQEKYHISYNGDEDQGYMVTKPNGDLFTFIQSEMGLYYLDRATDNQADKRKKGDGNCLW